MKNKRSSAISIAVAGFTMFVLYLHVTLSPVSIRLQEIRSWTLQFRHALAHTESRTSVPITCNRSHREYDLCSINGPTLLDPMASSFFYMGPTYSNSRSSPLKIQPYPRKGDRKAMASIKELTLTEAPPNASCGVTHSSPALVFSAGGYTGNFFHAFMDGFLPLFITVNSIFADDNQDFILVISDCQNWWLQKYAKLLRHFSRRPIININDEIVTHCFPSATLGLIKHGSMIVDPTLLPNPKTLLDFQTFIKHAYTQNDTVLSVPRPTAKPRLVLLHRSIKASRSILNIAEVRKRAAELGFDVVLFKPSLTTSLEDSFNLIHASHAMLGVHGAALTHFLFLRPGSVLMQVVPIGTRWVSDSCFGKPARVLGMEYIDYEIGKEESSLIERYGKDDLVLKNPNDFVGGNWTNMRVYMKMQNVKIDMDRFEGYLRNAYKKAKDFLDKNG